jgi:hypothetical protein
MRRMAVVASVLSIMVLAVTIGSALALDCHGRLVVIGASPWEVTERCGEPTAIEDMMKHLPQRAYDSISQTSVYMNWLRVLGTAELPYIDQGVRR